MKLVNVKETYDVVYPEKDKPIAERATFTLRKLSAGEVNSIDDEITISRGDESFAYLGGTASKMKINLAVVGWKHIEDNEKPGQEVPCTSTNKELLPAEVQQFLVRRIDEDNGLRKTEKRRKEEKNL